MKQDRKKTTTIVVVLIASVVVCCLGVPLGCLYSMGTGFGSGVSYTLTADGDRLFVKEDVSQRVFVVEEGKPSEVKIDTTSGQEIVINDSISENRQKAFLASNYFWSPRHKAVYFFNQYYDKNDALTELWQWSAAKNFEKLHVFNQDVNDLHESLDGKFLTGTFYEFGDVPKGGVVTYNIDGHEAKQYQSTDQMREVIMIAPDRFFIVGNPSQIWTPSANKTVLSTAKPIGATGGISRRGLGVKVRKREVPNCKNEQGFYVVFQGYGLSGGLSKDDYRGSNGTLKTTY